jgi:NADPH-dependent 2,4-dienoyl-CoA reductase/sulfur reductase-like enzyme
MTLGTVIVGASIGGVRTAQALRSAGYEGEITLVSDERALPYDRPPLSKGLLAGTATPESLTLLSEHEAADLGVRLMLGRAARHLDVAGAFVELVDGERLAYDDVVVATGAWGYLPEQQLLLDHVGYLLGRAFAGDQASCEQSRL